MNRLRNAAVALRLPALGAAVIVLAAGCATEGQPVDAGGERGGGGLAFVLLTASVIVFVASLFYMDRLRKRAGRGDR